MIKQGIDKAYSLITDEGEERSCKAISEEACKEVPGNFFCNVFNGASTKLAEQLVSPGQQPFTLCIIVQYCHWVIHAGGRNIGNNRRLLWQISDVDGLCGPAFAANLFELAAEGGLNSLIPVNLPVKNRRNTEGNPETISYFCHINPLGWF